MDITDIELTPLRDVVKNPSGWDSLDNYAGEIPEPEWLCVLTRNRDSDELTESNWRCALQQLGGESDNVTIDRFGHWGCGWWEALSVKAGSPQHRIAQEIQSSLSDYPVLDEDDYTELQDETADRVWRDCYNDSDRIEYIREHRDWFTFHSFADLLGNARGKYFSGYASELLH
jgi:hypothetical protein